MTSWLALGAAWAADGTYTTVALGKLTHRIPVVAEAYCVPDGPLLVTVSHPVAPGPSRANLERAVHERLADRASIVVIHAINTAFRLLPADSYANLDPEAVNARLAPIVRAYLAGEPFGSGRTVYSFGASASGSGALQSLASDPCTFDGAGLFFSNSRLAGPALAPVRGRLVFVRGGEEDEIVPAHYIAELVQRLSEAGAIVDFRVVPGGHGDGYRSGLMDMLDWLANEEAVRVTDPEWLHASIVHTPVARSMRSCGDVQLAGFAGVLPSASVTWTGPDTLSIAATDVRRVRIDWPAFAPDVVTVRSSEGLTREIRTDSRSTFRFDGTGAAR